MKQGNNPILRGRTANHAYYPLLHPWDDPSSNVISFTHLFFLIGGEKGETYAGLVCKTPNKKTPIWPKHLQGLREFVVDTFALNHLRTSVVLFFL